MRYHMINTVHTDWSSTLVTVSGLRKVLEVEVAAVERVEVEVEVEVRARGHSHRSLSLCRWLASHCCSGSSGQWPASVERI